MPVMPMPKLKHYNVHAMHAMAAAKADAATARARPRLAASPANVKSGWPGPWPKTQRAIPALGRPTALALPAHAPAQLPAQTPARTLAHVAQCVC